MPPTPKPAPMKAEPVPGLDANPMPVWTYDTMMAILHRMCTDRAFLLVNHEQLNVNYIADEPCRAILQIVYDYSRRHGQSLPQRTAVEQVINEKYYLENNERCMDLLHAVEQIYSYSNIDRPDLQETITAFCKMQAYKDFFIRGVEVVKDASRSTEEILAEIDEMYRVAQMVGECRQVGMWFFEEIDQRHEKEVARKSSSKDIFPTGFPLLNAKMDGGLRRQELGMFLALAKRGKSFMLAHMARKAVEAHHNVLFITLENSMAVTGRRFDAGFVGETAKTLHSDSFWATKAMVKLSDLARDFPKHLHIAEFPAGSASVANMEAYQVSLTSREAWTPDMIIIDYLDEIKLFPDMPRWESEELSATLIKGWLQRIDAAGYTATQSNRSGTQVNTLKEGQQAGGFGKIRKVDWAASLNIEEEDANVNGMRLYVMASRNSECNYTCYIETDFSRGTFNQFMSKKHLSPDGKEVEMLEKEYQEMCTAAANAKAAAGGNAPSVRTHTND